MDQPSDEDLMSAYQTGDARCFDALHERYAGRLRQFLARAFPRLEPDDLVQEAFLRLVRFRSSYRAGGAFRGWLYAIARNVGCERSGRARERDPGGPLPPADPAHTAAANEIGRAVAAAIGALPEGDREILVLSKYEGLTYGEIAEALGLSREAVKVRAFRALVRLREDLKEYL